MVIKELLADRSNYTAMGGRSIRYIVIHYTGNNGDTAWGNCNFFKSPDRGASAHYFVDDNEVWRSVRDEDKAWHCGGDQYFHPSCRNTNSIGIEICSNRDANGNYFFTAAALARAVELTKAKMQEYGIPAENVVRHYDVTHKICPAPFVYDVKQWEKFKAALTAKAPAENEEETEEDEEMKKFETINDVPEYARQTIQKLIDKGALVGDGTGLNVTEDFCRTMVILDRLGKLD